MSPVSELTRSATALAGGLTLAFLLSACGGGEQGAGESPGTDADAAAGSQETPEEAVELVDPMELAPDDLCQVLSEETLTELVGPIGDRSGSQESDAGIPGPEDVAKFGKVSLSCITVAVSTGPPRSHGLTYRLEISEELQKDGNPPLAEEEDADPSIELGDYAVAEVDPKGTDVDLVVIDGQVAVKIAYSATEVVDYEGVPYLDEGEMVARALKAAAELLAATGV